MGTSIWGLAASHFVPSVKKNVKIIFGKLKEQSLEDFSKAAEFFLFYPALKDEEYEWSNPRSEVFFEMLKEEISAQFLNYYNIIKKNQGEQ